MIYIIKKDKEGTNSAKKIIFYYAVCYEKSIFAK